MKFAIMTPEVIRIFGRLGSFTTTRKKDGFANAHARYEPGRGGEMAIEINLSSAKSKQIFARSSSRNRNHSRGYKHWTILQLTPEGFGRAGNAAGHMDLATLSLVRVTLEKVTNRWSDMVDFFRVLLDGANSLLDPVRHDHLLFDNEDFTKSREYFWAINCLVEFEASISANIEQWDEFRRYITPLAELQDSGQPKSSSRELLERSDNYCARLKRYQRFFQDKRTTTVALRDGVGLWTIAA